MTKQEEIKKMATTMCGYYNDGKCIFRNCAPCDKFNSQECSYKEDSEALYNAGYGDVSKYKAKIEQLNKKLTKCNDLKKLSDWQREEIEQLKAEVNKGCDNCEAINRAKIDVLKELKGRVRTSYVLDDFILGNIVFSKDIDELIEEVENEKKD